MYVGPSAHGMGNPPGLNHHLTDTEHFARFSTKTDVPSERGNQTGASRPSVVKQSAVV